MQRMMLPRRSNCIQPHNSNMYWARNMKDSLCSFLQGIREQWAQVLAAELGSSWVEASAEGLAVLLG